LRGRFWKAKKIENVYIVNINRGISIVTGLAGFILDQEITAGKISGAGIANNILLSFFNPNKKCNEYAEVPDQQEIINVLGSFIIIHGELRLALDALLKRENHTALSGPLLDAQISGMNNFLFFPVDSQFITLPQKFFETQTQN
jgi:predicted DNA-binding protein with PD1-like motif